MASYDKRGKPVQILRINGDHTFDINESQLETILLDERVKDKPVVVVSVAGAYRQGKSFLLSFFLRYLRNKCQSDWLDDTSIQLGGFEWRPGSKPHTTGILLWEEAFLVTTPQGEEVAVLLMDTQGSFDCTSTVKDCATIFALSVMTSSVQVYNVIRNIQEDQLQHLHFFAEYGKLAQKDGRNEPFQRLVFLVRDWAFPYEAQYGASGGRKVLEDRLEVIEKEHEELKKLRRQILNSFSKIDCFLMPCPGEKVEKDESFCGRLEDVHPEFKENLQKLVPWLLAPENLVVKKVSGEKITCQELMNYFKIYTKTFQGGNLPEPKSMLQATAEASNIAAKEKAMRFYMDGMEKRHQGTLLELLGTHNQLLAEASNLFQSVSKVGGEEFSYRFLENLRKELQVYFERLYKDEERREKEREVERQKEKERQDEKAIEEEREKQRQRERKEEKEKEKKRQMEREREKEKERDRERERKTEKESRQRDREREKEKDKQRERERESEKEQRQMERERENERDRQREREREAEKEQRQMDREREKEKDREREREREVEKEQRQMDREREKEKDRQREREKESERMDRKAEGEQLQRERADDREERRQEREIERGREQERQKMLLVQIGNLTDKIRHLEEKRTDEDEEKKREMKMTVEMLRRELAQLQHENERSLLDKFVGFMRNVLSDSDCK